MDQYCNPNSVDHIDGIFFSEHVFLLLVKTLARYGIMYMLLVFPKYVLGKQVMFLWLCPYSLGKYFFKSIKFARLLLSTLPQKSTCRIVLLQTQATTLWGGL